MNLGHRYRHLSAGSAQAAQQINQPDRQKAALFAARLFQTLDKQKMTSEVTNNKSRTKEVICLVLLLVAIYPVYLIFTALLIIIGIFVPSLDVVISRYGSEFTLFLTLVFIIASLYLLGARTIKNSGEHASNEDPRFRNASKGCLIILLIIFFTIGAVAVYVLSHLH